MVATCSAVDSLDLAICSRHLLEFGFEPRRRLCPQVDDIVSRKREVKGDRPVGQGSDCFPRIVLHLNGERPSLVLGSVGVNCYFWPHTLVTLLFCDSQSNK